MAGDWLASYIDRQVKELGGKVGREECALAAVSGGVDSTTAAVLAYKALGSRVHAVFIDTGFMREGEAHRVKNELKEILPLEIVDYSERFLGSLEGLSDAEEKRKKFRSIFYSVLSEEAVKRGCRYLVQGTIAPDIIETVGGIKTQHNVLAQAGLNPLKNYGFTVLEPLKELYKDEVRRVARLVGVPDSVVERQPFPGPGLLIRVVGELSRGKLSAARRATRIVEEQMSGWGASQYFAAVWIDDVENIGGGELLIYRGVRATGVRGDARRYGPIVLYRGGWSRPRDLEGMVSRLPSMPGDPVRMVAEIYSRNSGKYAVAIRAVVTEDFMTADILDADRQRLEHLALKLASEIPEARRIVYDVTPKPPATIEYE